MLLQFGIQSQISNLVTLIGAQDPSAARSLTSIGDIQRAYHSFIEHLQKRRPSGAPGVTRIITSAIEANQFRSVFTNDSLLDDKMQSGVIRARKDVQATEKRSLLKRALKELALYSNEHRILFDTVITDIFILPSEIARAGSTSNALGVIWANPKIQYSLHDVIEMLVHELTHHEMFLDELRHAHYDYKAMLDKRTWARSAILHVPRPLDKVLHSAVVATEILLLREQILGHPIRPAIHPPTLKLMSYVGESLASMDAVLHSKSLSSGIFLDRAFEIFESVKRSYTTLLHCPRAAALH
ncbi:hypothetical protein C7414_10612 [Cupriavidus alkaliphilus]|uniref:aKG-HExxH-type peptide beta-hydroxylase n=1 Tax=Cupriavidus alkaliphilus TaxID=942866 RepID=UPI000815AC17|nr:HEXXH motif-containing putative peptide modification protein [Cupriavidus alkaliphilus]PVY78463.1 hypothetical protein C7414_10612 [Cupriavidus alkaliphilus]SCB25697.1 hypothetical protein GA0116996_107345 [Cupriavidus alkaliphilus]